MTHPLSLLIGWLLDLMVGDPQRLPHPVVWFGKMIAACERKLNRGTNRKLKGALTAVGLILFVFVFTWMLRKVLGCFALYLFDAIAIFYCLAGTTLIREVRAVFLALDRSLDEGRRQVARIVGRDTSELSAQEVRTAALETLAENLSDGVIAPLFWLAILAAHIDDIANYIPARLTALLMLTFSPPKLGGVRGGLNRLKFVRKYGRNHASPNSGYPESALAAILNCRFGGPHYYFGELFDKPYIGTNGRLLTTEDMRKAVRVNRTAEILMVAIVLLCQLAFFL